MTDLTPIERDHMMHALGHKLAGNHRNYFAATPETPDDGVWAALCERSLAELLRGPIKEFPYNFYRVTTEGREALTATSVKRDSET